MNNSSKKKLCMDLMLAQSSKQAVDLLKNNNLWDDPKLWRFYGDKPGSWGTINNQGDPAFALTEKITNSIDAVLMNKCWEDGFNPKFDDSGIPNSLKEAVHKYFETKDELKKYSLLEKIDDEDLNDIAGLQEYWDDKKTRTIADNNICVAVGGNETKYPIISIADMGEGQTPEKLPTTIMSLHIGNKKDIRFSQGKWNQGGAGAILHTGKDTDIQLQFVLTRRNPKILKIFPDQKTNLSDRWSFTILRKNKPDGKSGGNQTSEAVFLSPEIFEDVYLPLSFESETMPLMPSDKGQFSKEKPYGTLVILYEYQIATSHALRGDCLYRQLDIQVPKLPLPVRLYETRSKFESEKTQALSVRGFSNFQLSTLLKNKNNSETEDIKPRKGYLRVENYNITYEIFCFKKGKGKTYIPRSAGLLWTVNGQTHAISRKDIFKIDKLSFDAIQNDLLIVIDCSNITGGDREDFFKSSRDRLNTENHLYNKIREKLIEDLRENNALREIIEKRIDESVTDEQIDDPDTIKTIQELLQDLSEEEKAFLPPGFKLEKKTEKQEGSGKYNLPKKKFPTFFCFEELKNEKKEKQEINLEVEINSTFSLRMFTDAETDYFERNISPGKFLIEWIFDDKKINPSGQIGPNLQSHGLCTLKKINLPIGVKEGENLILKINVRDKENKIGFDLSCQVLVKPQQKKIEKKDKKNNKNNKKNKFLPEGGQGINEISELIQNPIIAKYVEKENWQETTQTEWNEDEVLHVVKQTKDGKPLFNLFLNKENINLLKEKQSISVKYTEKIIETKYKMGISLIAMFSLMQFQKDKKNSRLTKFFGENVSSEYQIDEVETIKIATRNAGKGIFALCRYIESIGDMSKKIKLADARDD